MKRTIVAVMLTALMVSGCARIFPGMSHRAAAPKQPAAHVATKVSHPTPTKTPASAPAKPTAAHKST
jgi:PBP1b-binding outer membrane lipoprotein LpoB